MSKINKIVISIMIAIVAIFALQTISTAAYGKEYTVGKNKYIKATTRYWNDPNLFCVEHHQRLYNGYYKVVEKIKIDGMVSTSSNGKQVESWHNAKLAYILSASNGSHKTSGQVAHAIWRYMDKWYDKVGKQYNKLKNFSITGRDEGTATCGDLLEKAEEYADNLKKGYKNIKDKTDKSKINIQSTKLKGQDYMKVGPFKWEFSDKLSNVTVYDQNGKAINNILYRQYEGNKLKTVKIEKIKSNTNFYVYVPTNQGVTKITKITGEKKINVKKVTITFLQPVGKAGTGTSYQNFILRNPSEHPETVTTDFDYEIELLTKISGYVWLDIIDMKNSTRNGLYHESNDDINDRLFNGITVRLKDKTNGQTVKETKTSKLGRYNDKGNNGNGEYLFEEVLISKLKDYYVEFEYDGLTYQNVIPQFKDPGSKAVEPNRDSWNQNFSVVEGESRETGYTRDANGNRKHNLSYDINEEKSTATLSSQGKYTKNNECITQNSIGQYTITANTDKAGYALKLEEGKDEIRYVNLGLYEREQPQIKLEKDLHNVRLEINGYGHTYNYASKDKNAGNFEGGFNVGIQFGIQGGNTPYTRAIYKSDIDYVSKDKDKELKAYMTYELKIKNQSSSLTTQVNSIVDYFDKNYTIESYGTKLTSQGKIEDAAKLTEEAFNGNTKYKKAVIPVNKKITKENPEHNVYITFALSKEAILKVLNDKENLNNVAEINSYSIFKDGKIYAGIDKVSNPANAVLENIKSYEGDTDASPGLKLQLTDAPRTLTGKVFLDDYGTKPTLQTGKIRQGDGKYTDGEKGIAGVTVTLKEEGREPYTATTNENGDFEIKNYVPGNYTLTYTWGDQTYTVQKYKGTVYKKDRNQDKNWYKDEVDTRYTDAIDNYAERLKIDEEMQTVNQQTKVTKTEMNSTTPIMGLGIEKDDNGNEQYGITSIETEYDGDKFVPVGYNIRNVDFGIIERAKQQLSLRKRIKTLKATLANGQIIANIEIDENGKITGDNQNITYMKPDATTTPNNGFVRLELDNELIQGTILEVGYEIKATNESEKDYLSEEYYLYGIQTGEEITIIPSRIIDYLDKNWAIDEKKNDGWVIKKIEDIQDSIANNVLEDEESTIANKLILETNKLSNTKLKAGDSATVDLNVSKILTTTDEISLDNETEVLELTRPGGSIPDAKPGNYVPGKGHQEADDSMAETTIVTPATGENLNYIIPVLMGTSALLVLGAGIVLIKKKVLDNK